MVLRWRLVEVSGPGALTEAPPRDEANATAAAAPSATVPVEEATWQQREPLGEEALGASDNTWRPQSRALLCCSSPGCNFRVHPDVSTGLYCCAACAVGQDHGPECRRRRALAGSVKMRHREAEDGVLQSAPLGPPAPPLAAETPSPTVALMQLGGGLAHIGRRGRAAPWCSGIHVVDTFCGLRLYVPDGSLSEYVAPRAEEGGFDIVWPTSEPLALRSFGSAVAALLDRRGFCVVQMFLSEDIRQGAATAVEQRWDWTQLVQDVEEAYLGLEDSFSKVAWLPGASTPQVFGRAILDEQPGGNAAAYGQGVLRDLGGLLARQRQLGFTLQREPAEVLLRAQCASESERQSLSSGTITERDVEDGLAERFVDFLGRRRLCAMFFMAGDGASVELFPRSVEEDVGRWGQVALPVTAGKLLLFRHDYLAYRYTPGAASVVVQAWLMAEQERQVRRVEGGVDEVFAAVRGIGPKPPPNKESRIVSVGCRYGGPPAYGLDEGVAMFSRGADLAIEVPAARWDHSLYYSPNPDDGLATCRHCAFLDTVASSSFGYEFFGVERSEARKLGPERFLAVETSFEALQAAGYTEATLRREPIMVCGSDYQRESISFTLLSIDPSTRFIGHLLCVSLVAYLLGLSGKTTMVDTACSSSLTGVALAHQELRLTRDLRGYKAIPTPGRPNTALTYGIIVTESPLGWIGACQAHMMGSVGRCLTFDVLAEGYCYGEAACSFVQRLGEDPEPDRWQLATLQGTCLNQDGKSASLTAPSGPAQKAVLLGSLRDARREILEVSASEAHGNGMKLSDSIECGSLRSALHHPDRVRPLSISGGKTLCGHPGLVSGAMGILRSIMAMSAALTVPNNHLRSLSPHIDDGYPAMWATEAADQGSECALTGVSSFGFGGTNGRCDLWCQATRGHRASPTHYWCSDLQIRPDMGVRQGNQG